MWALLVHFEQPMRQPGHSLLVANPKLLKLADLPGCQRSSWWPLGVPLRCAAGLQG